MKNYKDHFICYKGKRSAILEQLIEKLLMKAWNDKLLENGQVTISPNI